MDRFREIAVFIAVAEEGSFSGAAKRMNMSAPAVTRAINYLEERLGIQLLCRTTRHVRVTTPGLQYLDDARPILDDLEAADQAILDTSESPRGEISILVPACISRRILAPIVAEFLMHYPETRVSVVCVNRIKDLDKEGFDLRICFGALPDNVPHAVVGTFRDAYCATPTYLKTHGIPQTPEDLGHHTLIDNPAREPSHRWAFAKNGEQISMKTKPRVSLSNAEACLDAVSNDFGIAQLVSYQVSDGVANGEYQLILEGFVTPANQINLVQRPANARTARASVFFDFLVERLRAIPQLQFQEAAAKNQPVAKHCSTLETTVPVTHEYLTHAEGESGLFGIIGKQKSIRVNSPLLASN